MSDEDRNCRVWLGIADYATAALAAMALILVLVVLAIELAEINKTLQEIRDRLPAVEAEQ